MNATAEKSRSTGDAKYRVVASPYVSAPTFALARSYSRIEDAFAEMGEGLVLYADGTVAAFHERHLRVVEAREGVIVPVAQARDQQ